MARENRIIFYDFETNGLNPFHDKILEIGAIDNKLKIASLVRSVVGLRVFK